MINETILEKVKKFPPQYQKEVEDFIEFIEEKRLHLKKKNPPIWCTQGIFNLYG